MFWRLDYRWTALVSRNYNGNDAPSLVVRKPGIPTLAQNRQQKDCRFKRL